MAVVAFVLMAAFLAVCFGARELRQRRETGSSSYRGVSGRPGSPEWLGGVLFVVALALGLLAPFAQALGLVDPLAHVGAPVSGWVGVAVYGLGFAVCLAAQGEMGDSWRVGVQTGERTALVERGLFAAVRNPFFTGVLIVAAGLALIVPNLIALAGLAALLAAVELQVRVVEEPYLIATHGEGYLRYGASAGRFVPGVGRLRG